MEDKGENLPTGDTELGSADGPVTAFLMEIVAKTVKCFHVSVSDIHTCMYT